MKKHTAHNTLIFCLIIASLLFASCKDKGNEEAKKDDKTAVEGQWTTDFTDPSSGASITLTLTFTGTNFTFQENGQSNLTDDTTNPPTVLATISLTFNMTGTFRLDAGQLLLTPKTATETTVTTLATDPSNPTTNTETGNDALTGSNWEINHETPMGAYVVNGNTLTITPAGQQAQTYTKQ